MLLDPISPVFPAPVGTLPAPRWKVKASEKDSIPDAKSASDYRSQAFVLEFHPLTLY